MSTLRLTTISNQTGSSSVPSETVINGSAKAWVNFNGTGTVAIRASFNVSSITDLGTGYYTVNFTTAMPDASYSAQCSASMNGAGTNNPNMIICPAENIWSASSINVRFYTSASYLNDDILMVSVAIFR